MMFDMVSSPLHVCGYGNHLRWSYNLCYTGVDVGVDASGDAVADLDQKYWRGQSNIILRLLDSIISIMLQKMAFLT